MSNKDSRVEVTETAILQRGPDAAPPRRRLIGSPGAKYGQVLTMRVGLHIPTGLAFSEWERAGRRLSGLVDSSAWWLGDWLVYGKDNYVDRYQRGIQAAGLQYQTLRNYAWVSRRFDLERRRAMLSFQHHAEVASLPVTEQEFWLDRAEQMKWTTKQLRRSIRLAREEQERDDSPSEKQRRLAVPGNRFQLWHKAADQSGIEFEQWVMAALDNAAEQVLSEAEEASLPEI